MNSHEFYLKNTYRIQEAGKKAQEMALSYCMQNIVDDCGDPIPMVDVLSVKGSTIKTGLEEIDSLIDHIILETLMAYEGVEYEQSN